MSSGIDTKLSHFADEQRMIIGREKNEVAKLDAILSTQSINDLQQLGYALVDLYIAKHSPDSRGNLVITLKSSMGGNLPHFTIRPREEVDLIESRAFLSCYKTRVTPERQVTGVIRKITNTSVVVFVDAKHNVNCLEDFRYSIKAKVNDIGIIRMFAALSNLIFWVGARPNLHHVLFGDAELQFDYTAVVKDSDMLDKLLNAEQRSAVNFALTVKEISVIHGPPGTGKTQTLVEIVRQLVRQEKRVLMCGPSNASVDNMAERLSQYNCDFLRIGSVARIRKSVQAHRAEEDMLRVALWQKSVVILTTLTSAGSPNLLDRRANFDVVIIDESAQAIESECWIAGVQAPKLILAGDHHQLPPTLVSQENHSVKRSASTSRTENADELSAVTMFERVRNKFGNRVCQMLTTQYRMHSKIMQVSNEHLYNNDLVAHPSVASHLLIELPGVSSTLNTHLPLVFIDTANTGNDESVEKAKPAREGMPAQASKSTVNIGEAELAVKHAEDLIASGMNGRNIAIITPYNGQVRVLVRMQDRIRYVEIGSIDGFQGSEKEAVILSLVRSNPRKSVGFLDDYRRINVAITRARRHLCVIADSRTISGGGKFLNALLVHLKTNGHVRKADARSQDPYSLNFSNLSL